ncbi:MAG: hypothetical protein N3B21_17875 [Clostridia bacterium]|nr:hypothetical protein [Clostridia bacterium]
MMKDFRKMNHIFVFEGRDRVIHVEGCKKLEAFSHVNNNFKFVFNTEDFTVFTPLRSENPDNCTFLFVMQNNETVLIGGSTKMDAISYFTENYSAFEDNCIRIYEIKTKINKQGKIVFEK